MEDAVRPLITWGVLPNDNFWVPRLPYLTYAWALRGRMRKGSLLRR